MDSNQSGAVGGIILGVFQGSLTHLGASRRLRGQKYIKARPILGHILTFFDPPCQPGQFFLTQNSLYRCPTCHMCSANAFFLVTKYLSLFRYCRITHCKVCGTHFTPSRILQILFLYQKYSSSTLEQRFFSNSGGKKTGRREEEKR